jgi:hypothetical protein
MGIGASLFLIAVGAILTFGLNQNALGWINIDVIGWILMLVGVLGLVLTTYYWNRRRTAVVNEHVVTDQPAVRPMPTAREEIYRERDYS